MNNIGDEVDAWLQKKANELTKRSEKNMSKNKYAETLLEKCMMDDLTHLTIADKNSTHINEKLDGIIDVLKILVDLFLYDNEDEEMEGGVHE